MTDDHHLDLASGVAPPCNAIMKRIFLPAVFSLALSTALFAAGAKTYQITGTVVTATGSMVTVQKGTERFEFDIDPATTKGSAEIKVGSPVTLTYVMSATKIETAGAPGGKTETPEASVSPGSSQ
jgi:hypothetical protein